ncbi:phage tail protein [Burkholderia sp. Bp9126]|nr:phage tail protein [Burkholderia sp. Bp9126]
MAFTAEQIKVAYPIPTYRYRVTVGDAQMAFTAVSGLEMGVDTIEYKDGLGNWYQMPGQRQALNITLRRGVVRGQRQLYDWLNSISMNQVDKKDVSISLTNEAGTELLVTWNVFDCFPTKLSAPNFDASSNEVAIEEIGLAALRMTIEWH